MMKNLGQFRKSMSLAATALFGVAMLASTGCNAANAAVNGFYAGITNSVATVVANALLGQLP